MAPVSIKLKIDLRSIYGLGLWTKLALKNLSGNKNTKSWNLPGNTFTKSWKIEEFLKIVTIIIGQKRRYNLLLSVFG